jgi:hypothetical protein
MQVPWLSPNPARIGECTLSTVNHGKAGREKEFSASNIICYKEYQRSRKKKKIRIKIIL